MNYCQLSEFYTLSTITSHIVSANGVNSLDFDTKTLLIENGVATTICGVAPTIVSTITTTSNNRPNHMVVNGDRIQWTNTASAFIPPTFASAETLLLITFEISTPTVSLTLIISSFTVTVAETAACSLSTFSSLSTLTSMDVIADGMNTLNFDSTTLVVVLSEMSACSNETPTIEASITTLSNNRPAFLSANDSSIQWSNAANNYTPSIYASATANLVINIIISTSSNSLDLSVPSFLVTVTPTEDCLLSSFAKLKTQTSLVVVANGVNALYFDVTTLV